MPVRARLWASPSGTKNTTFNPVIVSTETNIFGMDRSTPTNYLVPGNGNPAVSTSDWYQIAGLYNFRPYDLLQWGSVGATAMSNNGGKRYVWCCSADHPSVNAYTWVGGEGFYTGFSDQPSEFPRTFEPIPRLQLFGGYSSPTYPGLGSIQTYEFPTLSYNPDDPDGLPIYLFAETGVTGHSTGLWRSNDFVNFTWKDLSFTRAGNLDWAAFVRYIRRTGTNQYTAICLGTATPEFVIWTTNDGQVFTSAEVPIAGLQVGSTLNHLLGGTFTVGGQMFGVGKEEVTPFGGNNQHITIWPMNSTTFDLMGTPAKVRLQTGVGKSTLASDGYPGHNYCQDAPAYEEDGILIVTPSFGFCSDINTTAGNAGRGGAPYNNGDAGLDQMFLNRLIVRVDDTRARLAAPVQVRVSCASGTATISWIDALPQNTYRLYRGTSASTQATLIGDYTGVTSATDSPSTGRYWYKLVTLDNGTERQNRVVSVYVSSSSAFVNEHINRVLDDGGDIATINRAFLDRADTMLDSTSIKSVLNIWSHAGFGVKHVSNVISKVYDVGTTRLPRSMDFKAYTSNTTYSSTAVNTGPGWTNSTSSAYGYWGHIQRGNTIQKKRQITIVAVYERTTTASDFTLVGTGPVWGTAYDGSKALYLKHTAGSPGNIQFSLSDETNGAQMVSVAGTGSGTEIAIGTYDGTTMYAYSGNTQSSGNTSLDPNPDFGRTSGTPGYKLSALAGARNYRNSGTQNDVYSIPGVGFAKIIPFLGSGSVHCHYSRTGNGTGNTVVFNETEAQGKIQCIMVLERALNTTEIAALVTFLQSTTNW